MAPRIIEQGDLPLPSTFDVCSFPLRARWVRYESSYGYRGDVWVEVRDADDSSEPLYQKEVDGIDEARRLIRSLVREDLPIELDAYEDADDIHPLDAEWMDPSWPAELSEAQQRAAYETERIETYRREQ